jgi:lipoprotein-anchoring transpeptidase ErfK/SrfK
MTPSERSWRSQLLASAGIEKETMRARWIVSAILVILPAGSPSAQQSHLDTRYQIEQMAATFTEHYNKQDAAALASMFTKDALRVSSDGTAVTAVTIGKYQLTGQGRSGPLKMDGRWSEVEVREGGVWKIRLLTVTPKTAPNAVTPSTEANAARPESNSARAGTAGVLINIDKTNQTMTVSVDGGETYEWSVSTGKAGYSTPSGTYPATSMNEIWYSKQWDNAPMPHSIFFMKDGHAIHGSLDVKNLGKPVSHGCVRISPENAATLYALVAETGLENTQVVLSGATPGGEFKSARAHANPRRGLFGRSFGAPYYNGPQAYYGSPWSLSRW